MPKIEWGASGNRFFESGVERGVLYPSIGEGVPWDGLTAITEKNTGGEAKPYFYNGYKYLNLSVKEDFEATIVAYSAPKEFDTCDGSISLLNGLSITQQKRESFDLSYCTKIGNDIDGPNHGRKIHLVYNALAGPTERANQSLSESLSPMTMSWEITTAPPQVLGYRPSSHFIIDSRRTPTNILASIENILYGTDDTDPYMPSVSELMTIFGN